MIWCYGLILAVHKSLYVEGLVHILCHYWKAVEPVGGRASIKKIIAHAPLKDVWGTLFFSLCIFVSGPPRDGQLFTTLCSPRGSQKQSIQAKETLKQCSPKLIFLPFNLLPRVFSYSWVTGKVSVSFVTNHQFFFP